MLTTSASYNLIVKDLARSLANTADKPMVAREIDYYLENVEKVKSIDDFMKDDRLYRFAMKAFGLEDMSYAKAFMRKALTEGIESKDTFANKLADKRYRDFVETFNFVRHGETTTIFEKARQGTVDKYLRQTLEEDAGASNEGVRLALYFERKASGITSTMQLLADKALLQVVQTALGIPPTMSMSTLESQVRQIEKKLDVADLKDPEKLKEFLNRFTNMWELSNGTSASAASPALLIGQPIEMGISTNVLMSLQGLKLGGR